LFALDQAAPRMNLLDILQPDSIKAPLDSTDKRAAINEMVDLLAGAGRILDAAALKEAVWLREQTRTTGIGLGLAIPHGKCAGVSGLTMAIGKPAVPIDFQAIDQQPVKLIVMLASPTDRTSDHIQALAKVSRLMLNEEFRAEVYAAQTAGEIYELIKQQESR